MVGPLQTLRLFRKGRARHRREAQGGFVRNFVDPRLYAVRSGAHYQRGGRLLQRTRWGGARTAPSSSVGLRLTRNYGQPVQRRKANSYKRQA